MERGIDGQPAGSVVFIRLPHRGSSRVKVLKEGFVGRRRQLQLGLRVLKQNEDKVGLLIHGTGGLGKSCLAGKICQRFPNHHLIVLHGILNSISLQKALHYAFVAADDKKGKEILAEQKTMVDKLQSLCATTFLDNNYLLLSDDFEQNIEGAAEGAPAGLIPEAGELLGVLLEYLPLSAGMTQMIITCRYKISSRCGVGEERLEPVSLTGFLWAEQVKKFRELKHIYAYPDREVGYYLLMAGHGNPRLMECLDTLVGVMRDAEVEVLVKAVEEKQEDFIRGHVLRELLNRGGEEMERFLRACSIYRLPVQENELLVQGVAVGIPGAGELTRRSLGLSLLELDQARDSYQVTPLLREELVAALGKDNEVSCHRAAFTYYKAVCDVLEKEDSYDPVPVEEWIYHALGCGEEESASKKGGGLVSYLQENLAYRESLRVGEWVLAEKKQALANEFDALLLNELGFTVSQMGDKRKAIEYFEQALKIDRDVFGKKHPNVAIRLNNLGAAWNDLGETQRAIEYYEQALKIWTEAYGEKHPNVAASLNNLGSVYFNLGQKKKAADYFQQAYDMFNQFMRLKNVGVER
ncbi:MAG: tetratricopeptide repeat protein [bacterium]|nr:tetratricopeptide repeat protein [bacterium]